MGPCDCEVGSAKGIALRVRYKLGKFYDETFGVIADDEWRRIKIFGLLWRIYWSSAMQAMTVHYISYPTGIGQTKPICEKGGIAISSLSTTSSPFSLKNPLICTNIPLSKLALHGTPSSGGKKNTRKKDKRSIPLKWCPTFLPIWCKVIHSMAQLFSLQKQFPL